MPNTPAEQESAREEPGNPTPTDSADEQDQEGPRGHEGKTFLEHMEDSMNKHAELGSSWPSEPMMPLANLLHSAISTCRYCGPKAGVLTRDHSGCRRTYDVGFQEMVNLAAEAARTHSFDEKTLRLSLAEIARRSHGDGWFTFNLATNLAQM